MCCGRWGCCREGNVRVSLPPGTAEEDVERFLEVLPGAVAAVREKLGAPASAGAAADAARDDGGGRAEPDAS